MANDALSQAKAAKNDEFYTQFSDIEQEVNAYLDYDKDVFRGKSVLLPCDDPEWSAFTKFFAENFARLGLAKLTSTSFALDAKRQKYGLDLQPALFETQSDRYDKDKSRACGKIFVLDSTNAQGADDWDHMRHTWRYLEGTGDFASPEVCALRDSSDFIITNPPFSLFREFVAWIRAAPTPKRFLIIGNKNAITYKEIFPLIKENQLWVGATPMGIDMLFGVPDETAKLLVQTEREGSKYKVVDGKVLGRASALWFTNMEHGRRHEPMRLSPMKDNIRYNKKIHGAYPHYDNYDAIEVASTDAIPSDYDGVMGVPISFLDKYCPEQFEILGTSDNGAVADEYKLPHFKRHNEPYVDGSKLYKRIFIRHRRDAGEGGGGE